MAKTCPGENAAPLPRQVAEAVSGEVPGGEWKEVGKKGRKTPSNSLPEGGPTATTIQVAAGAAPTAD